MMATILNGQLPTALLATVPWDTAERLRPGALADLLRLNDAFRAEFGHNLGINESYRDLARQKAYYKNPPSGAGTAAKPGTSNHGWGLALDLRLTATEYAWMRANAPAYGWVNPPWAHDGRGVEEPWHWEHTSAESVIPDVITPAPLTPQSEEDDMTRFIELLYLAYLNRAGSAHDVLALAKQAQAGGWSLAQLEAAFMANHAEPGTVVAAFRHFMVDGPNAEQIAVWSDTETIAEVWAGVGGSPAALARR